MQNRYYRDQNNLPTLEETGVCPVPPPSPSPSLKSVRIASPLTGRTVFREVIFNNVKAKATQAIIDIINRCGPCPCLSSCSLQP